MVEQLTHTIVNFSTFVRGPPSLSSKIFHNPSFAERSVPNFQMAFPLGIAISLSVPIFLLSFALLSRAYNNRRKTPPPPPPPQAGRSWPVIGHLHLLMKPELMHITLSHLTDKAGPIFTLNLGSNQALIVSNKQIAKECLTTHDRLFATRPRTAAMEILGYNQKVIAFAPYGPYWRQSRKFAADLLSNNRLEQLRGVREGEVTAAITEIYQMPSGAAVNLSRWFGDVTTNSFLKMNVGDRISGDGHRSEKLRWMFKDIAELFGSFVASDMFPALRWFEQICGSEVTGRMKKTAAVLDEFAEEWLEQHKRKKETCPDRPAQDFMDMMFDLVADAGMDSQEGLTFTKTICMTFVEAAVANTTAAALTWAVTLLLKHPEALYKARAELEAQVGTARLPNESDIKKLPYLQAIIKETMRLYPPSPVSVAHVAMEDCTVSGYHVRAGTRLIINYYKIQHDPNEWADPLKFDPDRFFTTHKQVDLRGQNYELLPFGSGRRICSGTGLSLQVIQLVLATFIHGFEFANTTSSKEDIDMSQSAGITLHKAIPLQVFLTPRLPASCYMST